VDCRSLSGHQLIERAEAVNHPAAVEIDAELAFLDVDARYDPEITGDVRLAPRADRWIRRITPSRCAASATRRALST
jgi:hypothetical protein